LRCPRELYTGSDILIEVINPGRVIRERRLANGLTQQQLARRAGSTQAAVSRLERGELSPSVATVERLLAVMGEEASLTVRRMSGDFDPAHLADLKARTPAARLALALSWNRLAGELAQAGAAARAGET
jgi:transcriptional regulator with XRE-family HTH domain